ncbi:MAG TPA: hypothetical protein VJC21_04055 [Candidatus Nanoarchaeia archaeon]|nr:hypothetical protein [Candidatus Nanoarchaeia archaeon]
MVQILFSQPEGERQHVHDSLVERLQQEHDVEYMMEGKGFLWELQQCHFSGGKRYDLILYDSGFFWGKAPPEKRAELFAGFVTQNLQYAQTPVLVLADEEIQEAIRPIAEKAGFRQVDCSYKIEEVLKTVGEMVKRA